MVNIRKLYYIRHVSIVLLCIFVCTTAFSLAPRPASQDPLTKLRILAALERTTVRYADTVDSKKLLEANNADALLLSSGLYLVKREVADDNLRLLRAINHEDIEAVMQVLAKTNSSKYIAIRDLIIYRFPPTPDVVLPLGLHVNGVIARAFEWMLLLEDGIITPNEIPAGERQFIQEISPIINSNRHNYFTGEFWDTGIRGRLIKEAIFDGIRFYQVTSENSAIYSQMYPKLFDLAEDFRLRKSQEGVSYADTYSELLVSMMVYYGVDPDSPGGTLEEVLIEIFAREKIKNILEVGCGSCSFMAAVADIVEKAGVDLVGVDLDPSLRKDYAHLIEDRKTKIEVVRGDVEDVSGNFDIIFNSGVMSLGGFRSPEDKDEASVIRGNIQNSHKVAKNSVEKLSDNPKAAVFANTFGSVLTLYKDRVSEFANVELWDNSRRVDFGTYYRAVRDDQARSMLANIWDQGASLTILTKKDDELLDINKVPLDADRATVLSLDHIRKYLDEEDRVYTIRYDESRLTNSQIETIKLYIGILDKSSKAEFVLKPFSSDRGAEESLIAVYCKGENFEGEGHVDAVVQEGDIKEYLLRLTGMMNIALAASNIPYDIGGEELRDNYGSIIGFIRNQYQSIMGERFKLPKDPAEIANSVRNILLIIPRANKMPTNYIDEYNRMAREALISA